ncbi:unnamed protein product [Heligmosomoides polygyrus]|uniref:Ig-like domain-containing protein n=1 Tax=Heligmosomoides polygyrus TaxID=6339 RepID=A0A183F2J3_HELPZ|nr:unnamed protein product [Heligmosomoides polygyrus]
MDGQTIRCIALRSSAIAMPLLSKNRSPERAQTPCDVIGETVCSGTGKDPALNWIRAACSTQGKEGMARPNLVEQRVKRVPDGFRSTRDC